MDFRTLKMGKIHTYRRYKLIKHPLPSMFLVFSDTYTYSLYELKITKTCA